MSSKIRQRISLALNVVLAMTALGLAIPGSEPAPAVPVIESKNETTADPARTRNPKSPRYMETSSATDKRRWLVGQLRAMGVPNNVIARIVLEDLYVGWNKHAADVSKKCYGDPETMAALQLEIDMSRDGELRAALGEEGFREWDQQNMMREANSGKVVLTPAETAATYELWKKMQQRELELKQAKAKGTMDEADLGDALDKAVSEFKEQMKAVMGEERYARSQQTDDETTAATLRQDLAKTNPNDSQFQELLKTQQQWNEQRAAIDKQFQDDQSSMAYRDQIKALDAARDQEYRRVLGDSAFEALQKEQDPSYSRMSKYRSAWGLDDNSINAVYGAMKYYEKNVEEYQAKARALDAQDHSVDWDAVNRNLQQFSEQSQQSLRNYLGSDRFNRLQQNGILQFDPSQLFHGPPAL